MSEPAPPVAGSRAAAAAVVAGVSRLGAELRARGVRTGVGELLSGHRALAAVQSGSRADAEPALRAVFCSRREDLAAFAAAFAATFGEAWADRPPLELPEVATLALPRTAVPGAPALSAVEEREPVPAAWSDVELLQHKDFAAYSADERALARGLVADIARRAARRRSPRLRPARRRRGDVPDLRRTVRASLRYGGEPLERHWRTPSERPRALMLVCDVSGSMAPYTRMLLQYLQAAVRSRRRVEAFVFGTRLTRVTRELAVHDPDRALARAAEAAQDWSGGTRIGEALAELNRGYGRRVGRGADAVLLSDGWDRGDPEELAAEMARLQRCAHRLVWLNPLKAQPGYEPLTRGMQAALPFVDHFLAGNTLSSLDELATVLEEGETG